MLAEDFPQYATVVCEVEFTPTRGADMPKNGRELSKFMQIAVERALDGTEELTVLGRVEVQLS